MNSRNPGHRCHHRNFQSVSAPGTAYVLLHHVMGSSGGARGVWGYVKGGMGQLSEAIASAARAAGAEIMVDAAVEQILCENGRVRGVRLCDGREFGAGRVASGIDAHQTFRRLLPASELPADFGAAIDRIDYSSASMKINLALSELPDFTCLPGRGQCRSSTLRNHSHQCSHAGPRRCVV